MPIKVRRQRSSVPRLSQVQPGSAFRVRQEQPSPPDGDMADGPAAEHNHYLSACPGHGPDRNGLVRRVRQYGITTNTAPDRNALDFFER